MRTLFAAMLVISVWCGVALAKPKIAILGLEVIESGTKVDALDVSDASRFTEALRRQATAAQSKFELAPNSSRELIDEKFAGSCETEKPSCMAPIGLGLGAEYLVYGRIEKATEKGKKGYKVVLKLLDVKEKRIEEVSESFVSVGQLASGSLQEWAQKVHTKLAGETTTFPVEGLGKLVVKIGNTKTGKVYVDGDMKGELKDGTVTLLLPEGAHTVQIEAPDRWSYVETAVVAGGQTKTVSIDLELEDPGSRSTGRGPRGCACDASSGLQAETIAIWLAMLAAWRREPRRAQG